jgi:hypothetical protein
MLYADIKREVLSLINQYSVSGVEVLDTYNNQADYLKRIPQFVNAALMNIRTFTKPQSVLYPLTNGTDFGARVSYEMPSDFWKLKSGGVFRMTEAGLERTNDYLILGGRTLSVPKKNDAYVVEYYRFPDQLSLDAKDTEDIREDPDVIQAAEFYAAAMLVMSEDAFVYASLFNEYETRLARMAQGPVAEVTAVGDVYGFSADGGY